VAKLTKKGEALRDNAARTIERYGFSPGKQISTRSKKFQSLSDGQKKKLIRAGVNYGIMTAPEARRAFDKAKKAGGQKAGDRVLERGARQAVRAARAKAGVSGEG
jgi:hypothetical protein